MADNVRNVYHSEDLNNTTREKRRVMLGIINKYRKTMQQPGTAFYDRRSSAIRTNIAGAQAKWWGLNPKTAKKHAKAISKLLPKGYKMILQGTHKRKPGRYFACCMWLAKTKKRVADDAR